MPARMRIQALPGQGDQLTCALVFSPVTAAPEAPIVVIERQDAKEYMLGPRGWAVSSNGLRPARVELRGEELWLMFGSLVSWHVERGTPVSVRELVSGLAGKAIWPGIPRGREPTPVVEDDAPRVVPSAAQISAPPPPSDSKPPSPPELPPGPAVGPTQEDPTGGDPTSFPWAPAALALLVLAGAGGAWWWRTWPGPEPTPQPQAVPPSPCLDLATVLTPACPRDQLAALSPPEQLRLAEGLMRQENRQAQGMALSLLVTAAANGHGPAQLALGRLHDPASVRHGGPVTRADAGRALDLYRDAAGGGVPGAAEARAALVAALRSTAAGEGAEAERARTLLRQAGIE